MGLFGGDSKSTTNYETNTKNTSQAVQDGGTVIGEGGNYNYEMVNSDAVSVIKETNAFLGETFNTVTGLLDSSQKSAISAVATSNENITQAMADKESGATPSIIKSFMPVLTIGVVGFIGYKVLT